MGTLSRRRRAGSVDTLALCIPERTGRATAVSNSHASRDLLCVFMPFHVTTSNTELLSLTSVMSHPTSPWPAPEHIWPGSDPDPGLRPEGAMFEAAWVVSIEEGRLVLWKHPDHP